MSRIKQNNDRWVKTEKGWNVINVGVKMNEKRKGRKWKGEEGKRREEERCE